MLPGAIICKCMWTADASPGIIGLGRLGVHVDVIPLGKRPARFVDPRWQEGIVIMGGVPSVVPFLLRNAKHVKSGRKGVVR